MRLPDVPERLGLGVGFDLPWGAPIGFERAPDGRERVAPRVRRYLERRADTFSYLFAAWQPKRRGAPTLEDYAPAWDTLFEALPSSYRARALHQTCFNLGATEPYEVGPVVDFTNALIERYDLRWVNEDLGLWSLRGRPLPYPLPPYLTERGLEAAVANTARVQRGLAAPLVVEFPGFTDGASFFIGRTHAYDFFRVVVEETGSPATLDIGHLLGYQWLRGARGEDLYADLERLPLEHCFEIHLSGCVIQRGRFIDAHHGVLLDEQLELLRRLWPRCPNLRAVTYEDPRFDADGRQTRPSLAGFEALGEEVGRWLRA